MAGRILLRRPKITLSRMVHVSGQALAALCAYSLFYVQVLESREDDFMFFFFKFVKISPWIIFILSQIPGWESIEMP